MRDIAIHWFREDLRLTDNPALNDAVNTGSVLPIYILDDTPERSKKLGAASKVWLHYSLTSLKTSLKGHLAFFQGDPGKIIEELCDTYSAVKVTWNTSFEPWNKERDLSIKKRLLDKNIRVKECNASLLWHPETITKEDGTPFKVFTPFYRKGCLNSDPPRYPIPSVKDTVNFFDSDIGLDINELTLLPSKDWYLSMISKWKIGEEGAREALNEFLNRGINDYKSGRNFPSKPYVSKLSPYLHFGEISVHTLWHEIRQLTQDANTDHFCSELGWREFAYNLLTHNPSLSQDNLQKKFDAFPWKDNENAYHAWTQGKTGIPMVDAGMRELWQTGYMHNRTRMIVGSFLVKNLMLDWRKGEQWFWDCLFDANPANNAASWQWVAGCGADAAPYFRVFNPVMQGQKFDPDGEYIKLYVPELANMPLKYLYSPWEAPEDVLNKAGVKLGETYPRPIVHLKQSRDEALEAFSSLKSHA
jgi:deoxyribodipyrimidine photo-lyase